jgi:hypothetical protein
MTTQSSGGFNIGNLPVATTEKRYKVAIPFTFEEPRNDGNSGTKTRNIKIVLEYKPISSDVLDMPNPDALGAIVTEMYVELEEGGREELTDEKGERVLPTREFFASRPIPFVTLLVDGVRKDFFPAS